MDKLNRYRQQLAQTNWQTSRQNLTEPYADWLFTESSLTEKMQKIDPLLYIEVISEEWQGDIWQREVLIWGNHRPWIFAQTHFPKTTIEQAAQEVLQLGSVPIGLWLFPQKPKRLNLMWQKTEQNLYARLSKLQLKGHPLEIRELFLADFPFAKS